MAVRVTETAIQKATKQAAETGRRLDLIDAGQLGLRLRLTPAGSRTWVLACRDSLGGMRRFPLGSYPDMGVSEAREACRAMRAEVRKGADPVAEARRKRAIGREARDGIGTLTALLDLYAKQKGAALKSWPECRRRIDGVFASHLRRPLATLTAGDLQLTADAHASGQSAAAAVRYIRPVLKWAGKRGYAPPEAAILHPPATVQRRDRVLTRDELAALLPALKASTRRSYANALRLMLLTLARREEVGTLRWGDIDLKASVWTVPAERNKGGREHRIPLSRQAVALLRPIMPEKPKAEALVFATETGGRLANWDRETKALMTASKTTGWTRHDLRRTGATLLGELGIEPHIIEAALGHAEVHSRLAGTYNRWRYQPAVADALQRLADAMDGIESGGAEIVPIRRA